MDGSYSEKNVDIELDEDAGFVDVVSHAHPVDWIGGFIGLVHTTIDWVKAVLPPENISGLRIGAADRQKVRYPLAHFGRNLTISHALLLLLRLYKEY